MLICVEYVLFWDHSYLKKVTPLTPQKCALMGNGYRFILLVAKVTPSVGNFDHDTCLAKSMLESGTIFKMPTMLVELT